MLMTLILKVITLHSLAYEFRENYTDLNRKKQKKTLKSCLFLKPLNSPVMTFINASLSNCTVLSPPVLISVT